MQYACFEKILLFIGNNYRRLQPIDASKKKSATHYLLLTDIPP